MRAPPLHLCLLALLPIGLVALISLAGCTAIDPYHRAGMWQPDNAVEDNLAAMVANPADLRRGHGAVGTPGSEAEAPVTAQLTNPLPGGTSQSPIAQTLPEGAASSLVGSNGGLSGSGGIGSGR